MNGFEPTILVVIGNDCTGSCKSNYNTITTTMIPINLEAISIMLKVPIPMNCPKRNYCQPTNSTRLSTKIHLPAIPLLANYTKSVNY